MRIFRVINDFTFFSNFRTSISNRASFFWGPIFFINDAPRRYLTSFGAAKRGASHTQRRPRKTKSPVFRFYWKIVPQPDSERRYVFDTFLLKLKLYKKKHLRLHSVMYLTNTGAQDLWMEQGMDFWVDVGMSEVGLVRQISPFVIGK